MPYPVFADNPYYGANRTETAPDDVNYLPSDNPYEERRLKAWAQKEADIDQQERPPPEDAALPSPMMIIHAPIQPADRGTVVVVPNPAQTPANTSQKTPPAAADAAAAPPPMQKRAAAPADLAEVEVPPVAPPAEDKPEAPKVTVYQSPPIIVHRTVLRKIDGPDETAQNATPEQLSTLAPAAGGDADNLTPLIPLPPPAPAQPLPPPAITSTTLPPPAPAPASAPVAATPPVAPAPPVVAVPAAPAAPAVPPPVKAAATASTPAPQSNPMPVDRSLQSLTAPPVLVASTPQDTALPNLEGNPQALEDGARKKPAKPHKAVDNSEPIPFLSDKTKTISDRLPANLEQHYHPVAPFAIDHAKDVSDAADGSVEVKHESMGLSVEVKKPKFDANFELGKAYDAGIAGHPDVAIDIYKNVLENDPNNKSALFGLATLYQRAGQIDQARVLYGKLLTLDPNNRDGWNNFLALLAAEAPQDAIAQLEKLEAKNPDFSTIPAQLAVIYEKNGNYDAATQKMTRAIELAPENLTYRYNLAIMLDRQKKYEEAAQLYQQIIEAYQKGETIPGNIEKIQQRLTFISSNRL